MLVIITSSSLTLDATNLIFDMLHAQGSQNLKYELAYACYIVSYFVCCLPPPPIKKDKIEFPLSTHSLTKSFKVVLVD